MRSVCVRGLRFAAWSDLLRALMRDARRPLMRHGLFCHCVGADEAVFAQILRLAGQGARDDTMLLLSLLFPASRLGPAVRAAERVGHPLARIARHYERLAPTDDHRRHIH